MTPSRILRALPLLLMAAAPLSPALAASGNAPYDAVNPFIGTAADGNTFPAATLPFGMIQWGPDTRPDGWYHFGDTTLRGFSLTHLSGAGCPIYADIPILPWIGPVPTDRPPQDLVAPFSHAHEQAQPGYYAVTLDNGIKVELTTAARAGIARLVFPPGAARTLLIKAGQSATAGDGRRATDATNVEFRGENTMIGRVRSGGFCGNADTYALYFVMQFSQPFVGSGTWTDALHPGAATASGPRAGAYVSFPPNAEAMFVKVAVSFTGIDGAYANLRTEIPGWDFERVRTIATQRWSDALGKIETQGGSADERSIFYTGLYHMLLSPNLFSDANGNYMGFDGRVRRLPAGEAQYANFSDWDIYRDVVQLHALLFPQETGQMMQSLVRDAEQDGCLPRWPVANQSTYVMSGDPGAILLANAYAFGVRSFDLEAAKRIAVDGALLPVRDLRGEPHRPGLAEYLGRGYLPVGPDSQEGASITLEYASADFAISRLAAALGDPVHAGELLKRSQNWRKLVDRQTGFIRPRTKDGSFLGDWDPDRLLPRHTNWDKDDQMGFQEGSAWQYTWMVPHNLGGLIDALGGPERAVPMLEKFFSKLTGWGVSTFTVTNEPDFGAPYVYLWLQMPWKTQEVIDRVRRETFSIQPNGLPGNDDLGATSGVYVWSALGVYPAIPGVGGMTIGTPLFRHASLPLGDGRRLEITAKGEGIYVHSVTLNGQPYSHTWLPLESLSSPVNHLDFTLGTEPSRSWGAASGDRPPSYDYVEGEATRAPTEFTPRQ